MNQQLLVREVKRRNRLSNIMIAFGILMDLMPQAAVVHMIGNALSKTLSHGLILANEASSRSEERRVGKECRSRWSPYH